MEPIKNRVVTGPFGEVGIIAKRPGHGKATEETVQARQRDFETETSNKKKQMETRHDEFIKNFWIRSDYHCHNTLINRALTYSFKQQNAAFDLKKSQLKDTLMGETRALTDEYIDRELSSPMRQYQNKKKMAEEYEERVAANEKVQVQKARERIFRESCDEYKTKVQLESRKNLNFAHKQQMDEKIALYNVTVEEDKLWDQLMDEEDQRNNEKRAQEALDSEDKYKAYRKSLDHQIELVRKKKEEQEKQEQLAELYFQEIENKRDEVLDAKDKELLRQKRLCGLQIAQQLEENHWKKREQEKIESRLDNIIIDQDKRLAEQEQAQIVDNSAQFKREMLQFRKSLNYYKQMSAQLEQQFDESVDQTQKMELMNRILENRERRKKQLTLYYDCLEDGMNQIHTKRMAEKSKRDAEIEEAEILKGKLDRDEPLHIFPEISENRIEKDERANNYKVFKENVELEKYTKLLQQRENMEDLDALALQRKKSQENNLKVQELMNAPIQKASKKLHPFLPKLMTDLRQSSFDCGFP